MQLVTLSFLLLWSSLCFGQNGDLIPAEFPEGEKALFTYLTKVIDYPGDARSEQVTGQVWATFVIDPSGAVTSVKSKGFRPSAEKEVEVSLRNMPTWKPGTRNGKPISTLVQLPVSFHLGLNAEPSMQDSGFASLTTPADATLTLDEFMIMENRMGLGAIQSLMSTDGAYNREFNRGIEKMNAGKDAEALKIFNGLYPRDPENAELLFKRGIVKQRLEKTAAACKDWKRANKLGHARSSDMLKENCPEK